ncbi:MAG: hypothetical protein ACLU4N_05935 [Butyricimonas faecihominis]
MAEIIVKIRLRNVTFQENPLADWLEESENNRQLYKRMRGQSIAKRLKEEDQINEFIFTCTRWYIRRLRENNKQEDS